MINSAVSTLKAHLSEFLARVKEGQEVLVTDRGRPIAKIIPWTADYPCIDAHLYAMQNAGVIKIGKGRLDGSFWKLHRPDDSEGSALKFLLKEREEDR